MTLTPLKAGQPHRVIYVNILSHREQTLYNKLIIIS